MSLLTWIGIFFCISQSAMFSGMNLALFSISRLRLEVEADLGNRDASKVLNMRKDSNFLLATVLWGNVGINVLLTLLSNSVLAGIYAFFFSTVIITIIGEIMPQAYFSRHALRMASILAPVIKFYQILLYPAAKPDLLQPPHNGNVLDNGLARRYDKGVGASAGCRHVCLDHTPAGIQRRAAPVLLRASHCHVVAPNAEGCRPRPHESSTET